MHEGKSRVDFMLPGDIPVEVKNIVCADYREKNLPEHLMKSYIGKEDPDKTFQRSGIFPTGRPH